MAYSSDLIVFVAFDTTTRKEVNMHVANNIHNCGDSQGNGDRPDDERAFVKRVRHDLVQVFVAQSDIDAIKAGKDTSLNSTLDSANRMYDEGLRDLWKADDFFVGIAEVRRHELRTEVRKRVEARILRRRKGRSYS